MLDFCANSTLMASQSPTPNDTIRRTRFLYYQRSSGSSMLTNILFVTAFRDIGRGCGLLFGRRSNRVYMQYFSNMCRTLQYPIVAFIQPQVQAKLERHPDCTQVEFRNLSLVRDCIFYRYYHETYSAMKSFQYRSNIPFARRYNVEHTKPLYNLADLLPKK